MGTSSPVSSGNNNIMNTGNISNVSSDKNNHNNKKQKLDKPGTQVKVRGTALIPPMGPIVPSLQPRNAGAGLPPGSAAAAGGGGVNNPYQTGPGGGVPGSSNNQQGSPPNNAASLKPIQPKPAILGEPTPLVNPMLADLK